MSAAAAGAPDALYADLILERARAPRHAGRLAPADGAADGNNPLCGDRVHVSLRLDGRGRLAEAAHEARGCAISVASADLMIEAMRGRSADEIQASFAAFERMMRNGPENAAEAELPPGLLAFRNLHEHRSRIKCAALPWNALLGALEKALGGASGA